MHSLWLQKSLTVAEHVALAYCVTPGLQRNTWSGLIRYTGRLGGGMD